MQHKGLNYEFDHLLLELRCPIAVFITNESEVCFKAKGLAEDGAPKTPVRRKAIHSAPRTIMLISPQYYHII